MTSKIIVILAGIFTILAGIAVIYGIWLGGKWLNYKFAYESGVESTVKELVKPERLRETK